jgi:hypothetical protein
MTHTGERKRSTGEQGAGEAADGRSAVNIQHYVERTVVCSYADVVNSTQHPTSNIQVLVSACGEIFRAQASNVGQSEFSPPWRLTRNLWAMERSRIARDMRAGLIH